MLPMTIPRQTTRLSGRWMRKRALRPPPLRFTPYAWAKLLCLRDLGETEVGGFAVSSPDDLLLVEEICLVDQICTEVTVKFDDGAVADYFDDQVDEGRLPEQFARIWVHTHPGSSPLPSGTDEATFQRCFGAADWAVMFILAQGGGTYARLQFRAGPGGDVILPVEVDFSRPFSASDVELWETEYVEAVSREVVITPAKPTMAALKPPTPALDYPDRWGDPCDEILSWEIMYG